MPAVLTSFVLRLLDTEVADGRLAGEVESVVTGERATFNGPADLLGFCQRQGRHDVAPPTAARSSRPLATVPKDAS